MSENVCSVINMVLSMGKNYILNLSLLVTVLFEQRFETSEHAIYANWTDIYEIWGSQSNTTEVSSLLGCDAVLTCKQLLIFWIQYDPDKLHSIISHKTSIFRWCQCNAMTCRLDWGNPCAVIWQVWYPYALSKDLIVFWSSVFPS
jgi:hypothetical protein